MSIKVYKFSDESRKKMSEAHKGKSSGMLGKKHKPETILKIRKYRHSEEKIRLITLSLIGHKVSKETREKISKSNTGKRGVKFSAESKLKKSINSIGDKNPNWKGGISKESHKARTSTKYSKWKYDVFERDNYTCRKCKKRGSIYLNAHHIISFYKNKELRYDVSNGITFCKECHQLFHKIYGYKDNNLQQVTNYEESDFPLDK